MLRGLLLMILSAGLSIAETPVELGRVSWSRDYDAARASAAGKPLLVLFQEVPG